MDVPDKRRRKQSKVRGEGTELRGGRTHSLFVTLDPGVLVLSTVAFLRPFDVQLLVTELVGRRRLWRGHDGKRGRLSALQVNLKPARRTSVQTDVDLLSPQMYLHCLSLVLHLPLKQRPCGQTCRSISPLFNEIK